MSLNHILLCCHWGRCWCRSAHSASTATSFNGDISLWDVSKVTDMSYMFYRPGGDADPASSFNQDISLWDVSQVTQMNSMFYKNTSFNRDLSAWCVSNISSQPAAFATGATSWVLSRPVWGTCPT